MKFTKDWLDNHLVTKKKESQIIDKLNTIGLEVENTEPIKNELSDFIIARIIKANKHPNADRLKICDVSVGDERIVKVVCGAPNAQEGLLTVYAPPGSVIPKNGLKLEVSKIRGETSHGMLCSESELKLSEESKGIIELSKNNISKIGESYFNNPNKNKIIELSITPNRPDCLGVRGIARDLAACDFGKLKDLNKRIINKKNKHNLKVKINKEKNQSCFVFGSCLIKGIKNTDSPGWLKNRILALGLRPISAVVDVTNYVMFDLNRPLHAYDLDKIKNKIVIRNSKKGENLKALDNNNYTLEDNMCVIADDEGPLGLGGIIGGIRSGTVMSTKNILIESAYFDPEITRKTAKNLDINSDAKFRFERGIDPNSVELGLETAAKLITSICDGEVSKFDIQKNKNFKPREINFDPSMVSKIIGIKVNSNQILKILEKLGFNLKKKGKNFIVKVPTWRPDIFGEIDLVEEVIRIVGLENIKPIEPEKKRNKATLNFYQRHFHLAQRSVASKGYFEIVTWSFTDENLNNNFKGEIDTIKIVNPISSDLNVLRNSLFPNLIFNMEKNLKRGFEDQSLFEIGPVFIGKKPGEQITVICGLKKRNNQANLVKIDVFEIKKDLVQTLIELGIDKDEFKIMDKTTNYYHPGISGSIFSKKYNFLLGYFGELHPKIVDKTFGFEIFLENLVEYKSRINKVKESLIFSDFQKSDRDFAFVVDKNLKAQNLSEVILDIDNSLIKDVKIFDVYEGENIPYGKKSIALKVTIQSDHKTLNENDLTDISKKIVNSVEEKIGAKLRS
tara:strand:+ start:4767 stop:7136 length:2370 start_codon:yes stop_codon:yes gene_type:complete